MEVREIIPNLNKRVKYDNGTSYTLNGSTIRKDENGKVHYYAELLDRSKPSVLIVRLESVECLNT